MKAGQRLASDSNYIVSSRRQIDGRNANLTPISE
jgi:hypothetical protein